MSVNENSKRSEEISERLEEEDIEEEIEEVLSGGEASVLESEESNRIRVRTRQLFDLGPAPKSGESQKNLYDNDDLLSGEKIAEHFKVDSDLEGDSLEQVVNELESTAKTKERDQDSPQNDVILINDQKVSINSLKEKQDQGNTSTNQSTTNDVSDLAKDDGVVSGETSRSKSFELESSKIGVEELLTSKSVNIENESLNKTLDKNEDVYPNDSIEEDKSVEEVLMSNHSIDVSISHKEDEEKSAQKSLPSSDNEPTLLKPMERCLDFGKEVLEDISEESDQVLESLESLNKLHIYPVNKTGDAFKEILLKKTKSDHSFFGPISNQMMISSATTTSLPFAGNSASHRLEALDYESMDNKVKDLQEVLANKDALLASLSLQLDNCSRRDSKDSLKDSIVTNTSTEYRTIQDEYLKKMFDIQGEIVERDQLIEKLTDSLQSSLQAKEKLQEQGEKLAAEVLELKKQLTEAVDTLKKPNWNNNQQDEVGSQRLSEVSLDLVSDEENFSDTEIKVKERDSKEREEMDQFHMPISKQIEQFQKYLNPEELRLFFMVQKKFDDFLSEEVEKVKMRYDGELKILADRLDSEKVEKEGELTRLRGLLENIKHGSTDLMELKQELEVKHSHEMESLRRYFEKKCADMEKHYSEEVFSQSQKHSLDSGSDLSDDENSPLEAKLSPRKEPLSECYQRNSNSQKSSPRKTITPQTDNPNLSADELRVCHAEKIKEMSESFTEQLRTLKEKLKRYEAQQADDEFMVSLCYMVVVPILVEYNRLSGL